jgi:hypothetical protein
MNDSTGSEVKLSGWDNEAWNRRIFRWGIWAFVVLGIVNGFLNYVSIIDRRQIHEAEQVTNARLNARAEIHILLVRAYVQQRPLTIEERRRIFELWEQARYPQHLKNMLDDIQVKREALDLGGPLEN